MTLVVSDNSPLNLLVRLGLQDVLPTLFARLVILPAVAGEMAHPKAPAEVRSFVAAPPPWLTVQPPAALLPLPHLDPGEAAAISLAADRRDGRSYPRQLGRGVTVTWSRPPDGIPRARSR